ncbi:RHS repeat-associated core domain-containing protein [Dyadobacter sp. NIV53]|uniref:RHS repeat-associated core domain-containing protein n=1 Tax=Dyadobacter sp. NIV53 TaxID=2861765 RepID=UPI001C8695A3|nr:RHS repeat-associated core domain-containing protein [Dyadobacter sp. NIV53]
MKKLFTFSGRTTKKLRKFVLHLTCIHFCILIVLLNGLLNTAHSQTNLPINIDFETPPLGSEPNKLISPYTDAVSGVTFTTVSANPTIGLVKNSEAYVCLAPSNDDQKFATGAPGLPETIGHPTSQEQIKATFPMPTGPVTISVDFQSMGKMPVRLRLYDAFGKQVTSVRAYTPVSDIRCSSFRPFTSSKTLTASGQDVAYAVMDLDSTAFEGVFPFVIDNFTVKAALRPIETTFGPPSRSNPSAFVADPVNTATGNYFLQRTDFSLAGRGMPVVFMRTYNSQDTSSGPFGHGWTYSYNISLSQTADSLITIRHTSGETEYYRQAANGTYTSLYPGIFSTLTKKPDLSYTLTETNQTRYHFASSGKLISIEDRNGNKLSFQYDMAGSLITISGSTGLMYHLDYDDSGHIKKVTDPISRSIHYFYDSNGDLISSIDPKGGETHYVYQEHRMTHIVDPRQNSLVENTYDSNGKVISQKNGRGFITNFAYGVPQENQTSITDPLGNTSIHEYDSQLRIVKEIDPYGFVFSVEYDSSNNRTAITDMNGNVSRLSYDQRGNVLSMTDPIGNQTFITYDSTNNPTSLTDPMGFMETLQYDEKGNLQRLLDPLGNVTEFENNDFGEAIKVKNARGFVNQLGYNEHGHVNKVTNALNKSITNTFDIIGRPLASTNQNGNTSTFEFDANNKPVKAENSLGYATSFNFDENGNLVRVINAKGNSVSYEYDEVDNLTKAVDALGHITQYTFDPNNNLSAVTDANGNKTTYSYDALNRLVSVTEPLGNKKSFTYDRANNITAVNNPDGKQISFTYDKHNQLVSITPEGEAKIAFEYDANGNRTRMVDQRGDTQYTYDALGQIKQVTYPGGKKVSYTYDVVGNPVLLTYPDGKTVKYQYDALNRLEQVTNWMSDVTRYEYDDADNVTGVHYPNSTSMAYQYDAAERLIKVSNKWQDKSLAEFTYKLDELGLRIQTEEIDTLSFRNRTVYYTYDAVSQLTKEEEKRPFGLINGTIYQYDPVGNRNRTTKYSSSSFGSQPEKEVNYIYNNNNQLLKAGNTVYEYDANGNRSKELIPGTKSIEYTYNFLNRITQIVKGGSVLVQYQYDGEQNKIEQTYSAADNIKTIRFVNDVISPLAVVLQQESETNGKLNISSNHVYGLDLIGEGYVTKDEEFNPFLFFHSDGLGSTVALTTEKGTPQGLFQYDAFGNTEKKLAYANNRFLYAGEELDPKTSLYYMRARWYDPKVGRFLTKDPLAGSSLNPLSFNAYTYALNNPVNFIDPSGELSIGGAIKSVGKGVAKGASAAYKGAKAAGSAVASTAASIAPDAGILAAKLGVTALTFAISPGTSSLGLLVGTAGWLTNPKLSDINIGWGAIEFSNNPAVRWMPGSRGAITIGGVILYKGTPTARQRANEYDHIWQARFFGDAYIPAHLAIGGTVGCFVAKIGGNAIRWSLKVTGIH